MNKSAIQKFAVQARRDLIEQVKQQAFNYGINEDGYGDKNAVSVNGNVLSNEKRSQRIAFITAIEKDGYEQVIEKVAYTWFNRFIALRFMEVNDYLPTHIRVLSDEAGAFKPEILKHATTIELVDNNGNNLINKERVFELLENPEGEEELFRYILLTQCNSLYYLLPKMFSKVEGYIELLLPLRLLSNESVIGKMISEIDEDDFKEAVEIIGWMYQYYNTEAKDAVFADLKKNIKISRENIPVATQLFTPDWIVRYMVENSLGRIAVDKLNIDPKTMGWKYYLEEAEQTEEVKQQLAILNDNKTEFKLEDLKVIDPCMGSGHVLVYAFNLLVQVYENQGYSPRDAVKAVTKNNIYGLDIDGRAAQLAYFALKMTGRKYDRRFLTRDIEPQVYAPAISEDLKEYGSLVQVDVLDEKPRLSGEVDPNGQMDLGIPSGAPMQLTFGDFDIDDKINDWNYKRLLNQKYDVVVTNPPYMSQSGMNSKLTDYLKSRYDISKSDLFAIFIEKSIQLAKDTGYVAMITMQTWMFLSSYLNIRNKVLYLNNVVNMLHLGAGTFEELNSFNVLATSFVMRKTTASTDEYIGNYVRLNKVFTLNEKEKLFFDEQNYYKVMQGDLKKLPSSILAYWISDKMKNILKSEKTMESISPPRTGMMTSDNKQFLRAWFEPSVKEIGFDCSTISESKELNKKWFPYIKGGNFRRWYGNREYVVNWYNEGQDIRANGMTSFRGKDYYFKEGITWSIFGFENFCARLSPVGSLFDIAGTSTFPPKDLFYPILALLNSKIAYEILILLNPSVNFQNGDIKKIPIDFSNEPDKIMEIEKMAKENVTLSKLDWDADEISWDFERHSLVNATDINTAFENWEKQCTDRFNTLKQNEEELNRIFIDIYGLQDELTHEVENKDVTVRLADKTRDIKSFISYAVGCMFGRYSLDVEGLAYAGGELDDSKYTSVIPDMDNIIPICDDEYFEDDIVGRFIKFVGVVYGTATLEENLEFIASALGTKGTAREVIRNYFLNGFYADHCKIYSKRPIYWQFDSGKKNGFKALIYMHRYESNLLARMRTDYVHEQQERYRTQIAHIEDMLLTASNKDKAVLTKTSKKLAEQAQEILKFEEKVHHLADQKISIDLDDGVVKNYALFSDVVTKIK